MRVALLQLHKSTQNGIEVERVYWRLMRTVSLAMPQQPNLLSVTTPNTRLMRARFALALHLNPWPLGA